MGNVKLDFEDKVCERADEIAHQRYAVDFCDVPKELQMAVWNEAEAQVRDAETAYYENLNEFYKERRMGIC